MTLTFLATSFVLMEDTSKCAEFVFCHKFRQVLFSMYNVKHTFQRHCLPLRHTHLFSPHTRELISRLPCDKHWHHMRMSTTQNNQVLHDYQSPKWDFPSFPTWLRAPVRPTNYCQLLAATFRKTLTTSLRLPRPGAPKYDPTLFDNTFYRQELTPY